MRLARTLERITRALAAGAALAAGCGPGTIGTGDDMGEGDAMSSAGDDPEGGASITSGPSSTTSTTTSTTDVTTSMGSGPATTHAEASADEGPSFDLGVLPDVGSPPPPSECFDAPPREPACDVQLELGQLLGYRCMPQEVMFSCEGITPEDAIDEAYECLSCSGSIESVPCGPVGSGLDTCCHWFVYTTHPCPPGRPFIVDGQARLPGVAVREDWAETIAPGLDGLDPAARRALAEAWAQDGCFEHASIASFARFVLELLAVGAPSSLVVAAQRALGEEASHARAFFGLASAYGGRPVGPETLDVRGALASSQDRVAIAEGVAREGCIGETISALQLQVAAQRAIDPRVRERLRAIAEQELRHVELAWSALTWLMARGDARLRERVAQTFAQAARYVPRAADASDHVPAAVLHAHGRLTARERRVLAERALARLVAPAAARLLEPWTVRAPACMTRLA